MRNGLIVILVKSIVVSAILTGCSGNSEFQGYTWGESEERVYETPHILIIKGHTLTVDYVPEEGDFTAFLLNPESGQRIFKAFIQDSLFKQIVDISSTHGNIVEFSTTQPLPIAANAILMYQ